MGEANRLGRTLCLTMLIILASCTKVAASEDASAVLFEGNLSHGSFHIEAKCVTDEACPEFTLKLAWLNGTVISNETGRPVVILTGMIAHAGYYQLWVESENGLPVIETNTILPIGGGAENVDFPENIGAADIGLRPEEISVNRANNLEDATWWNGSLSGDLDRDSMAINATAGEIIHIIPKWTVRAIKIEIISEDSDHIQTKIAELDLLSGIHDGNESNVRVPIANERLWMQLSTQDSRIGAYMIGIQIWDETLESTTGERAGISCLVSCIEGLNASIHASFGEPLQISTDERYIQAPTLHYPVKKEAFVGQDMGGDAWIFSVEPGEYWSVKMSRALEWKIYLLERTNISATSEWEQFLEGNNTELQFHLTNATRAIALHVLDSASIYPLEIEFSVILGPDAGMERGDAPEDIPDGALDPISTPTALATGPVPLTGTLDPSSNDRVDALLIHISEDGESLTLELSLDLEGCTLSANARDHAGMGLMTSIHQGSAQLNMENASGLVVVRIQCGPSNNATSTSWNLIANHLSENPENLSQNIDAASLAKWKNMFMYLIGILLLLPLAYVFLTRKNLPKENINDAKRIRKRIHSLRTIVQKSREVQELKMDLEEALARLADAPWKLVIEEFGTATIEHRTNDLEFQIWNLNRTEKSWRLLAGIHAIADWKLLALRIDSAEGLPVSIKDVRPKHLHSEDEVIIDDLSKGKQAFIELLLTDPANSSIDISVNGVVDGIPTSVNATTALRIEEE